MNNQEVAHRWAQRRGGSAKGSNLFYEDDTLYSYGRHFIVGRHVESPKGVWFVVMNPDTYSSSTARHQSYARRALPSYYTVIHADPGNASVTRSAGWVEELMERRKELYAKFMRARSNKPYIASQLEGVRDELAFLKEQYDLDFEVPDLEYLGDLIEEEKRREEERQRAQDHINATKVSEWKLGVRDECPHTRDVHLRVKGENIETSWGANVPLEVAPFVWRMAERKESYTPVDSDVRLGPYTLNKIDEHGDIVVGCHTIRYNELRRIAVQLGYITEGEPA
jgi:hypothetical protein